MFLCRCVFSRYTPRRWIAGNVLAIQCLCLELKIYLYCFILLHQVCACLFDDSPPSGRGVAFHLIGVSLRTSDTNGLFVCFLVFLRRNVYLSHLPFKKLGFFFNYWVVGVSYRFWVQVTHWIHSLLTSFPRSVHSVLAFSIVEWAAQKF
jgi:hypothetical protein